MTNAKRRKKRKNILFSKKVLLWFCSKNFVINPWNIDDIVITSHPPLFDCDSSIFPLQAEVINTQKGERKQDEFSLVRNSSIHFFCLHCDQGMSISCCLPYDMSNVASPSRFFSSGSRSSKTFKPKKNIPEGTHQYDLMKHAAATLGSGNLRLAVMLPDGEDQNEWVAVNSKF